MIWLWLILLAAVYVVVAIVVGKVCAINSRWEKTVDHLDPNESDLEQGERSRLPHRLSDSSTRLLAAGRGKSVPLAGGPVEGVRD